MQLLIYMSRARGEEGPSVHKHRDTHNIFVYYMMMVRRSRIICDVHCTLLYIWGDSLCGSLLLWLSLLSHSNSSLLALCFGHQNTVHRSTPPPPPVATALPPCTQQFYIASCALRACAYALSISRAAAAAAAWHSRCKATRTARDTDVMYCSRHV